MTKRASRRIIGAVAIAVSTLLASPPSFAQTAAERETARTLFEEGKVRRDKGDKEGALESFKAADALVSVPTTKLAVARAYLALGKLVDARDAAVQVANIPVAKKEPQPFTDARAAAAKLANDLQGRIPSITFDVVGAPQDAPDDVQVEVDGVAVPAAALVAPRKVNPGKHTVVAKLKERDGQVQQDVTVEEKATKPVTLDVTEIAKKPKKSAVVATAPPPEKNPATTEPPNEEKKKGISPLVWIGGGVAIVGAAAGTVFGLMSMSDKESADQYCRDGKCPPPGHDAADSAKSEALISTISFAVAGVGAGVAIVGLFLSRSSKPSDKTGHVNVSPYVSYGAAGFTGSF